MKTLLVTALTALTLAAPAFAQDGPMEPGMMFEALDTDKDGNVTQAEIDAAKTARFAAADTNSDGKLDEAEMLAQAEAMQVEHMAAMLERMKAAMPKRVAHMMIELDANSDGFVTPEEMDDSHMARMFDRLDENEDAMISVGEAEDMRHGMHGGKHGRGHGWFGNWFGGRN